MSPDAPDGGLWIAYPARKSSHFQHPAIDFWSYPASWMMFAYFESHNPRKFVTNPEFRIQKGLIPSSHETPSWASSREPGGWGQNNWSANYSLMRVTIGWVYFSSSRLLRISCRKEIVHWRLYSSKILLFAVWVWFYVQRKYKHVSIRSRWQWQMHNSKWL